jgi:hypothetical protein
MKEEWSIQCTVREKKLVRAKPNEYNNIYFTKGTKSA